MPTTRIESHTRGHEHRLEIAASAEEVWKALTDAAELANWFPFEARVEVGQGGTITYDWGDGMTSVCRITTWDPPGHLRTSWLESSDPDDPRNTQLAVDWFVEGEGGHTRLRLVHSGFGPGSDWDDEFDGTQRGWRFELQSLKHYLEHHRGKRRAAYRVAKPVSEEAQATWDRLIHPQGLVQWSGSSLQAGDRVHFSLSSGDRVDGKVLQYAPPWEFSFTVEGLNRGLMRVGYETCFGRPEAQIWVSLWGVPQEEDAALRRRLVEALDGVFA